MPPLVRSGRAFTLIELMIGIAILAIVLAMPRSARNSVQGLALEAHSRRTLRNARVNLDELRRRDFDRLPPELLEVAPDGTVSPSQPHVVPGSLKMRTLDGGPPRPGARVVAEYRFCLPERGEAHTVPSQPPHRVELAQAPVHELLGVFLAAGETLQPISASLSEDRKALLFPASLAGRVVVADYLGEGPGAEVWGSFLSENLRPTDQPTAFKLLHLQWNGGEPGAHLTLLRVRP
ncbi:MAG: type II secretion system protein [Candidatus Xenobium sp.]|jgi:prepilin-type N-terminal cleavage/methylation domain-containing protein|nr:type II secretion system protein [Burkholderiales bacterium]